jgi:hypothetical protein
MAQALAEEFRAACPELQLEQMYREKAQEVKVDVTGDSLRYFSPDYGPHHVVGTRVVVRIPFIGDAGVFGLCPNTFTYNPPRGRVIKNEQELALTIEYPNDSPRDIDGEANAFIGTVQHWLTNAGSDIASFNGGLEHLAHSAIAARRHRIQQRDEHLATSKIPEGRPGEKKTYIAEAIVRRPAPKLPTARPDAGVKLEPVLEVNVFEHILGVVRLQALQMEQATNTYKQLDEESRRDLFLGTLNTHYEGRGAAEAFNVSGKTDILIKLEGRNLFIAECKFWEGAKGFAEAIDQLFGYASWRDTKLALIVFVREKGLTGIVEKAREALAAHTQFGEWQEAGSETELRATVSWPGDERRHADLNVFLIHTPA